MLTNNRDIILAQLLAVAMLVAVLVTDSVVPRMVLALPLVFFLPGHLAMRAFRIEWQPVEHVIGSIGMSIAIALIGCFVLFWFSSLWPIPWASWFIAVIGALSIWIIARGIPGGLVITVPRLRPLHAGIIAVALLGTIGAYGMALYDESTTREYNYTELWLLPTKPGKFIVGIKNEEFEPKTYDLRISTKTEPISEIHSIVLKPGEQWTQVVSSNARTDAVLYVDQVIYRRVSASPATDSDENR